MILIQNIWRDSFSLASIFVGMKIEKKLLHVEVHVQVQFLNVSNMQL